MIGMHTTDALSLLHSLAKVPSRLLIGTFVIAIFEWEESIDHLRTVGRYVS